MSKSLLIINAKTVNENKTIEQDIYIRNGRIEELGQNLASKYDAKVLDVKGKFVIPGMIDDQVHFREPGMPKKGTILTESRAAVAGGITSFMDMPNTIPNVLNSEILEEKIQIADRDSIANFAFYHGASNDNLEAIKSIDPTKTCGLKIFMGASTGNMLVDNPDVLEGIFKHSPVMIATHCEDTPTIIENEESYRQVYGDDIPFEQHYKIRSEEACLLSSKFAVELAKSTGARLHVLHISTAKEAEMFSDIPMAEKQITAEACLHFLFFSSDDYEERGALIKCNPAIKTPSDRAGIIQGLLEGRLDVIGTDHAPHTWDEKQGSYFKAPSGLPLVQHALPSLLEHYHDGIFSMEFIVNKTSHAVAELFNIEERGYIREGYWADLVILDVDSPIKAVHADALSKCKWTPFDGFTFRSSIHTTLVNGQIVYANNVVRPSNIGKRLSFDRS